MRLLVFAPHPDDEIIGCGGLIQRRAAAGDAIKIIVVSDGAAGGDAATRARECLAGLASIGISSAEFWRQPDGALPLSARARRRYLDAVESWLPTHIALPSPHEAHPDHRRLTRGLLAALTRHWRGELLFYESTTPLPSVNRLEPIDIEAKLAALECHVSQLARYDYAAHVRGLASLRGAACGVPAAEAYIAWEWDGSPQNFFEQRPLVSVILRADDLILVAMALESLRQQSYDQIEAIVVWHGEEPLPDGEGMADLDIRVVRGPGPRAANLNAGLAVAQGAFVAFLDQDDVLHANHLALLLAELQADSDLDIAFGDCRLVACVREGDRVREVAILETLGQEWRPGRLLVGNHIPLHSFLCSLRLARRIAFDAALNAYEDWDFLARAELAGATFRHVPELVCDYRLFPEGDEAADLAIIHQRKGFTSATADVRNKILHSLNAPAFDNLAGLVCELEAGRDQALIKLSELEKERDALRQEVVGFMNERDALVAWADLLAPDFPGNDPGSRLAGCAFDDGPCISIILPVCDPAPEQLLEAIQSVARQTYARWQLCLADDASTQIAVRELLDGLATGSDDRVRVVRRGSRGGIVAATQSAVELATGEWLAFLDHDDRLDANAMLEIAAAIQRDPQTTALYTDSRMIDRNGVVLHTYRKPGWAPETLLHLNYINHLSVVRRAAFDAIGGLRNGMDGSQDWDLWLRLSLQPGFAARHVPLPLYDWRAGETSVAYAVSAKPYVIDAACRALADHLHARGFADAVVAPADGVPGMLPSWSANVRPLTAIIPTHRNPQDLDRLLMSLAASDYPALEVVLIANRVTDERTRALLAAASLRPGWRVFDDDRSFNWSALNNAAVRRTTTPWLLFLNDDVELPETDTLPRLVRYLALDPAIGAVGARLEFGPEQGGGVQHDGIVTDRQWVAGEVRDDTFGDGFLMARNVSAVTGACLLTTRSAYDACGGFDERLAVSYNDVDFCLHLRRMGYRIVQASDVRCIHRASRTRGQVVAGSPAYRQWEAEGQLMRDKWGEFLGERMRMQYVRRFVGSRIISIAND
jgi:GT2 family glycosyltransferase/LmbE family N-acetylglucosaminyl deacetylase